MAPAEERTTVPSANASYQQCDLQPSHCYVVSQLIARTYLSNEKSLLITERKMESF